jgi:hypothetical protein
VVVVVFVVLLVFVVVVALQVRPVFPMPLPNVPAGHEVSQFALWRYLEFVHWVQVLASGIAIGASEQVLQSDSQVLLVVLLVTSKRLAAVAVETNASQQTASLGLVVPSVPSFFTNPLAHVWE